MELIKHVRKRAKSKERNKNKQSMEVICKCAFNQYIRKRGSTNAMKQENSKVARNSKVTKKQTSKTRRESKDANCNNTSI